MSVEEIIPKILTFVTTIVGSGPWGWAITAILGAGLSIFFWYYRKQIRAAIQKIAEKKRMDEQAKNPVDNQSAEDDALKSEKEIDEILKKGDN